MNSSTQSEQNILKVSASYELDVDRRTKHQNLLLNTLENHRNVVQVSECWIESVIG